MSEKDFAISKKICMLGSFGVGKTSLVRRFVYNEFKEDYLSTIGVHIHQKVVSPSKDRGTGLKMILWDIAHIEKFNGVIRNYFRGAHGAIVVFDMTRPGTFDGSSLYLKPFLELNPKSKIIFVGNKIDLLDDDAMNMEQLLQLNKTYHAPYILTSARTNKNVTELFDKLGTLLLKVD